MENKAKSVKEYIRKLPIKSRKFIKDLTDLIKKSAPEAEEYISYGMPAYKLSGRILIYCAAFKNHYSLFPGPSVINELKSELKEYETSKGTIKFSFERPIPKRLISKIIAYKVELNISRTNKPNK
ncbi:MAG: DUF1801 domain-containing protein [Ignavibacteriae bacterium]|nr:DUF1801 domain-containing protein [Ignavibacteriota bacterium]